MTVKLKFKKQKPQYLAQFFTEQNEAAKNLKTYFYMEDGELEQMKSCEKFTYAFSNGLDMYTKAIGYIDPTEKYEDFNFEVADPKEVAKSLLNEYDETVFVSTDSEYILTTSLTEFSDFTKAISEKRTFLKFVK